MFLPDLTGYAPVPGSDGRRLDPWRGGPCSGAGSADQVIDFFLGKTFLMDLWAFLGSATSNRANQWPMLAAVSRHEPCPTMDGNCFVGLKM